MDKASEISDLDLKEILKSPIKLSGIKTPKQKNKTPTIDRKARFRDLKVGDSEI